MLSQGLKYFTNAPLSVLGMLIFFVAFSALAVWTFSGARPREFYDALAGQPLDGGEE